MRLEAVEGPSLEMHQVESASARSRCVSLLHPFSAGIHVSWMAERQVEMLIAMIQLYISYNYIYIYTLLIMFLW